MRIPTSGSPVIAPRDCGAQKYLTTDAPDAAVLR